MHSTRPFPRRSRAALAVPAVALAAMTVAACGAGSSAGAHGTGAAVSSTTAAAGTAGAADGFAAYTACLAKHGLVLPTRSPGEGSGARPHGGFGGGFGGLNATSGPAAEAAKACASLRPAGGFGGANSSAVASQLNAYRSCLSDHGVALPSPAPRPSVSASQATGRRRDLGGLGALNTADPKVAAALKACAALRPTFGRGGTGGAATPKASATPGT